MKEKSIVFFFSMFGLFRADATVVQMVDRLFNVTNPLKQDSTSGKRELSPVIFGNDVKQNGTHFYAVH